MELEPKKVPDGTRSTTPQLEQPESKPTLLHTEVTVNLGDGCETLWEGSEMSALESKLAATTITPAEATTSKPTHLPEAVTVDELHHLIQNEILLIPSKFKSRTMIRWYTRMLPLGKLADAQGRSQELISALYSVLSKRRRYKAEIIPEGTAQEYLRAHIDHYSDLLYEFYLDAFPSLITWRYLNRLRKFETTLDHIAGDIVFMNPDGLPALKKVLAQLKQYLPTSVRGKVPRQPGNSKNPIPAFQLYITRFRQVITDYLARCG